MTIHMKSLGISVEETAIIYGVFPLFSILAPYTMGFVADKLGNFKVLKITKSLTLIRQDPRSTSLKRRVNKTF